MSIKKWAIFAIKLVGRLVYVWMPQWVQDRIDESMREFDYLLHPPKKVSASEAIFNHMEQHLKHVQSLSGITESMKKQAPKKKRKPAAKKVVVRNFPMVDNHQEHIEATKAVMDKPKRTRKPKVTPPQEPVAPIQI